jgi:hypothetical protein
VGSSSATIQSSATAKGDNQDMSLSAAIESEGRAVAGAVPRN